MQLSEAQASARQVLDAERHSPTTVYMMATPFANELAMMVNPLNPNLHPKPISEKPGALKLRSRNYELLESFYGEIQSSERGLFLGSLRDRISARDSFEDVGHEVLGAGKTNRTNSELPLIGEFNTHPDLGERVLGILRDYFFHENVSPGLLVYEESLVADRPPGPDARREVRNELERAHRLMRDFSTE
jgi:hypothetical protein